MSAGFHRLGANAGKVVGWSNKRSPMWDGALVDNPHLDRSYVEKLDAMTSEQKDALLHGKFDAFEPGPPQLDHATAKSMGFTGDACPRCGSMRMVHSGTCNTCQDCASTTGCS